MGKTFFENLEVWQDSMGLAEKVYQAMKDMPKVEQYGLTDQIRRSAISVSSNIAEGSSRGSDKEFIRFLYISLGSLAELQTQLMLSIRLNFIDESKVEIDEIVKLRKKIYSLISAINKRL